MTSRIRHRRGASVPPLIEPGEVRVDTANRQLVVGDIDGSAGVPLAMVAVRYFDARASYALHDYAVQAGSLYRANVAISPGPFNPNQWTVVSGDPGSGGAPEHTPLHGYGDGANHTLILHNPVSDSSQANTISFNNNAGVTNALLWNLGGATDSLRIQSAGNILLAPGHIGFDDSLDRVQIDPDNVIITQRSTLSGGLVLQNRVNDTSQLSQLMFRNAAGSLNAALSTSGDPSSALWMQSGGVINLVPGRSVLDGAGVTLAVNTGGVGVSGILNASGTITTAGNLVIGQFATVSNSGGNMVVQAAASLYLRSPTGVIIADSPVVPTYVAGPLQALGSLTAVQGATLQSDLMVYRSGTPSTGLIYLGNTGGRYLYLNSSGDLESLTQRIQTLDPTAPAHAATKNYVDSKVAGAIAGGTAYLPLAGGTMTGRLVTAGSEDLTIPDALVGSVTVVGAGATWAALSFAIPGTFGTNFGLKADGNFYMGGYSHGSTAYKFWTTRDFTTAPIGGVRLSLAADYPTADTSHVVEPFPGATVTGISFDAPSGLMMVRYRYLQVLIGTSWVTVALA